MFRALVDPSSVFIRHQTSMQPTGGLYWHKLLVDGIRCSGLLRSGQSEALEPSFPVCLRSWEALWHDQDVQ